MELVDWVGLASCLHNDGWLGLVGLPYLQGWLGWGICDDHLSRTLHLVIGMVFSLVVIASARSFRHGFAVQYPGLYHLLSRSRLGFRAGGR